MRRPGCQQRPLKGCIQPRPQVPISQRVEAKQGGEVREAPRPGGLQLQELEEQYCDQGDPDLHLHGVLTGAHEGFEQASGVIVYSDPKTDIRISDITKLNGTMRTEIRGDVSGKLMETQVGASVWSSSAWVKRQIGGVSVSPKRGVSTTIGDSNPGTDMVPALMFHLTEDFRQKMVRQRVNESIFG